MRLQGSTFVRHFISTHKDLVPGLGKPIPWPRMQNLGNFIPTEEVMKKPWVPEANEVIVNVLPVVHAQCKSQATGVAWERVQHFADQLQRHLGAECRLVLGRCPYSRLYCLASLCCHMIIVVIMIIVLPDQWKQSHGEQQHNCISAASNI